MSHIPERREKDCLNCGTIVQGRYCHTCGQENVVPKETFWHMVTHFFYDITHFDSSFFSTVKILLFKPGFLSREYMNGKRATYLHPIRMYVFTSAVFFLLFFSVFSTGATFEINLDKPLSTEEIKRLINKKEKQLARDSGNAYLRQQLALLRDSSQIVTPEKLSVIADDFTISDFSGNAKKFKSAEAYDSAQALLPPSERDGWFKKRISRKEIEVNRKYSKNPELALKKLGDVVLHRLPYMLFVSLPLFALLLKFVYIRRKQFYFADHGVFTIHLYVFSFILLMLVFTLSKLESWVHSGVINFVIFLLFLGLLFYLYKGMKNFYGQGRLKTLLKFLFVALFSLLMMLVLFFIFAVFSAYTL